MRVRIDETETSHEVVWEVGQRVWIRATIGLAISRQDARVVGDGTSSALGPENECVVSVPREWVTEWLPEGGEEEP